MRLTDQRIRLLTYCLFTCLSLAALCGPAPAAARDRLGDWFENWHCKYRLNGVIFQRTELFFGTNKPGGQVSDAEFQQFLDTQITPRFPDGLTLLSGDGQFKNSAGAIERERSKLLVLLYVFNDERNRSVEEIRERYKTIHQQQSVLRADARSCVSF